jgi:hypothetical protein
MKQMYTIYIKQSSIRISTSNKEEVEWFQKEKEDSQIEIHEPFSLANFISIMEEMLHSREIKTLEIRCPQPKSLVKELKQSLKYLKAAGGLVRNEKREYLFIFRLGYWDLPKGKL